ncbi:MAG: DUF2933 domain-containing protein [Gammaproteobacteria bacterium]|nr:DUF2933 domain-containing protein [Gammaproteobacteria bacterium]
MSQQSQSFWFTPKGLAALGLIGAASYFLLVEHREHLFQFLPYLILLLCPLMHIFMHGGHGGHGGHGHQGGDADQDAYQRGLEDGRRESENRHHH